MNTKKRSPLVLSPSSAAAKIFLIAYSAIVIYPMIWTVSQSFKTNEDFFDRIFSLPKVLHFQNYADAWTNSKLSMYFMNSVVISVCSILLMLILATTAAHVLARYEFKLNKTVTLLYVAGIMIPAIAGIIPLFLELKAFHMLDNRGVIVLLNAVSMMPFAVFMLINFFKTIPKEIEEAAVMDGCSKFQLFHIIMLPLAKAGIVTLIIIEFISVWGEVYFSLILLSSDEKKTLQIALLNLHKIDQQRANYTALFAATVIVTIPSIVVYTIFQKKIIEGVSLGAIKG